MKIGVYLYGIAAVAYGITDIVWGEFDPSDQMQSPRLVAIALIRLAKKSRTRFGLTAPEARARAVIMVEVGLSPMASDRSGPRHRLFCPFRRQTRGRSYPSPRFPCRLAAQNARDNWSHIHRPVAGSNRSQAGRLLWNPAPESSS